MKIPFFDTCFGCKKLKFNVKKRPLTIPPGIPTTSREKMCKECFTNLKKLIP